MPLIRPNPQEDSIWITEARNGDVIDSNSKEDMLKLSDTIRILNSLILVHRNSLFLDVIRENIDRDRILEFYLDDKNIQEMLIIIRNIRDFRSKVKKSTIPTVFNIENLDYYLGVYDKAKYSLYMRTANVITLEELKG